MRMLRLVTAVLVPALLVPALLVPHPALAKEPQSGSKTGTATVQCASDPDGPVCGTRIAVLGNAEFTVTPDTPIDLDVYFYTDKGELTDQFVTTGCAAEAGRISEDARTAVVVIPRKPTCGRATSVGFTYAYRVVPRPRCPEEINATCRPLWAKVALLGLLALLLSPVVVLVSINLTRRARDRRTAVS